ncbi:hypothetical protein EP331_14550 [bacterium]|nr:MAG: hypothetical protein EP331_14550 [bacterium]
MNKRVLLFLGAGVSIPSGLPSADQLLRTISSNNLSHYLGIEGTIYGSRETEILQKLIHLVECELHNDIDIDEKVNYELIYHALSQLESSKGKELLWALSNEIRLKWYSSYFKNNGFYNSLEEIADYAMQLINLIVSLELSKNSTAIGFEFISKLLTISDTLSVFTLNHDLLLERYLDEQNIYWIDGFKKEKNGECVFKNSNFLRVKVEPKIRLFKLHGGINWAYNAKREIVKKDVNLIQENIRTDGVLAFNPQLILTGSNKYSMLYNSIYADLHYNFRKMLYSNRIETVFVGGYSWNDKPYNELLLGWLLRGKKRKMIIWHKKGKADLLANSNHLKSSSEFNNLVSDNRIKILDKWPSEFEISDFNS